MPVKLVDISSIETRRFTRVGEKFKGNIRIDHNSTITNLSTHPDGLEIEFRFTANYQSLGLIKMEGTVIYAVKEGVADMIKSFQNTRNLPPKNASEVHNAVLQACLPIAMYLARDVKLPPPLPLPSVNFQKQQQKKKKGDGVEVV